MPTKLSTFLATSATGTAASHYYIETADDGFIRPKALAGVQAEIVTDAVLGSGTANSTYYLRGDRTWGNPLSVGGIITDASGNIRDIVNSGKSAAYIPTVDDNGKMINITTGGVTINAGIFSAGQNITIYNNSASSQTITQGATVTLRLAGTATTGNRTLAQRGIATVVCVASNEFVCSGAGLT
jgi:hypothetical protein